MGGQCGARWKCPQIWRESGEMVHMCALMGVQAAGRERLADPSPGLPSSQGARPSTHVAAGAPRPIGAAPGRCGCHSGSCMCITHTCPRHPARISLTAPPTCALCSASTKILGVGTTLVTGKLRPQAREPFRVEPGWAGARPGAGLGPEPTGRAGGGAWR